MNLTYTRSIRLPADQVGLWFKARLGTKLLALGLGANTAARIARQLWREHVNPELRWQRVALQPFVNFDFFSRLYRRHQPEFASFHTNHVAHYMHTYWKAMQPEVFPQETTPDEVRMYGGAIEYGYRTADELLKRMLKLLDCNTVLVVASSMGQKPFISNLKKGKAINQLRSLERLLDILGVNGKAHALFTMSGQFNIYPDTSEVRDFVVSTLQAAYIDTPDHSMFVVKTVENGVTATLKRYDEITDDSRCVFPHREKDNTFRFEDLVYSTGMVKSGWHDPKGMMVLYGPGIRRGGHIAECNNLDIAPTLLTLLGLPVPAEMKGRVLKEAFSQAAEP